MLQTIPNQSKISKRSLKVNCSPKNVSAFQQIFLSFDKWWLKLKMVLSSAENINFLTADGKRFAHPLHHLGKSQADLPLIAIDSFRHMYLFKDFKDIFVDGKLKKFVEDLHSGKLHRYAKIRNNVVPENTIFIRIHMQ